MSDKAKVSALKGADLAIRTIVEQALMAGVSREHIEGMLDEIEKDVRHHRQVSPAVVDDETDQG